MVIACDGVNSFLAKEAGLYPHAVPENFTLGAKEVLALPGSAYLYQGEELGLHEVADIPGDRREDPVFWRSGGAEKGRDGCRVPLPWASDQA